MIITPSVGIVYPGDVGIVLRLSLELFLVHDAPVIRQPFFRRQFIVLFIFPYGVLAENRCYLYHVSLGFEYLLFNGYQTRLPEPV